MSKHPNAVKWLVKLASTVQNTYEYAQLLWEALAGGVPYPWATMKRKWLLFRDA